MNGGGWARGNYAANAGPGWYNWTLGGASDGTGGPWPSGADYTSGGVVGINWGCPIARIPDGTSNTILLAEVRIGVDQNDRRGTWAMGLAGSSVIAAAAVGDSTGPNDANPKSDDIEDCGAIGNYANLYLQNMGCSWDNAPHNWPNWQGNAQPAPRWRQCLLCRWQRALHRKQHCPERLVPAAQSRRRPGRRILMPERPIITLFRFGRSACPAGIAHWRCF